LLTLSAVKPHGGMAGLLSLFPDFFANSGASERPGFAQNFVERANRR
jgi:hypothetical protein